MSNGSDITTENVTNLTADDTTATCDFSAVGFAYLVSLSCIIPIGLLFNLITVAVFVSSKSLRDSTTGLYLVSLAVGDSLFLVGELLRSIEYWLERYDIAFLAHSDYACQFVFSLRYGAKLVSAWITVAITTERCVIVTFPLRAGRLCTRRNTYIVILVVYVASCILGSFPIFTVAAKPYNGIPLCLITNKPLYNIANWIVLRVGSLLLPGLVVIMLTAVIILHLTRAYRNRARCLVAGQDINTRIHLTDGSFCNHGSDAPILRRKNKGSVAGMEKQLTAMLLSVAWAFILLRLPYTVLFYVNLYKKEIWKPLDGLVSFQIFAAYKASDVIATVNYCVNFFLYCITGSGFRAQLRLLFHCPNNPGLSLMSSGRRTSTSTKYTTCSSRRISDNRNSDPIRKLSDAMRKVSTTKSLMELPREKHDIVIAVNGVNNTTM